MSGEDALPCGLRVPRYCAPDHDWVVVADPPGLRMRPRPAPRRVRLKTRRRAPAEGPAPKKRRLLSKRAKI